MVLNPDVVKKSNKDKSENKRAFKEKKKYLSQIQSYLEKPMHPSFTLSSSYFPLQIDQDFI